MSQATFDIDLILENMRKAATPKTPEERKLQAEAAMEDAHTIAACFATPEGKAALALLWRKFGAPMTFDAGLGFFEGAAMGFQRSGSAAVLNWIGQMIQKARTGKAKRRT